MADMKLFIELLARSTGLKRELRDSETGFRRFGSAAKREMDGIRQASGALGGQLAALGITVGVLQQFRMSAQLDKDLTQIGQTAGVGSGKVAMLRSDLFRMGKESGQDIESLKNGFNSLVQSGLNMREATSTLDGVNIAMAVTGAKAETLSAGLTVAAQAFQFDLAKPGQALVLLDKMTVAGRLGNAELESLSQIFARVGVNAQAAGLDFNKTLGFVEALSKVERNPERLATLADSTLRVFTNMNYMAAAQKGTGIRFYSQKGDRRDPLAVLQDVKKKYDTLKTDFQRDSFIQAAFGKADLDTIKGIRTLLQSGSLNEVAKMSGLIADAGGTLKKDFSAATRNLIDQAGRLKNTMRDAADGFVGPINETLAKWIQHMLTNKANGGMGLTGGQMIGGAVALTGGAYLASRIGGGMVSRALSRGGSTAIGVAEGKVLQAAAGVTPVFITNWPANLGGSVVADALGGAAGGGIAAGGGKKAAGWMMRKMGVLAGSSMGLASAELLPLLLAGGAGYGVGTGINHALGGISGWSSGGKYKGSGWMGEQIYDAFHPERIDTKYQSAVMNSNSRQAQNYINLQVQIDSQGRIISRSDNMSTSVKEISKRGDFFAALTATEAM